MKLVSLLMTYAFLQLQAADRPTPYPKPAKASLPAEVTAPCTAESRSVFSRDREDCWLEAKLAAWQRKLGLVKWRVTVETVRVWELRPNTLGNVKWNLGRQFAAIHVLNPADYTIPEAEIPEDTEYTIVHELIHIRRIANSQVKTAKEDEEKEVNEIGDEMFRLEGRGQFILTMRKRGSTSIAPATIQKTEASRKIK